MTLCSLRASLGKALFFLCVFSGLGATSAAFADGLPPDVQAKADKYKQKLAEWAATPAIVEAVKKSSITGGIAGMTNAKWDELSDKDPIVTSLQQNAASKLVSKWEEDKSLGKLNVRDVQGNLVAFSSASGKPLLYNNATRPAFVKAMQGAPWAANEIKPDPTTGKKSVQLSAPVMDGGKPIGIIHTALEVE